MLFALLSYMEPSLKALLSELHPFCASWYNIGLELDIPYTTLDSLKQNYLYQYDLMHEMLKEWFITWLIHVLPGKLLSELALRSPIVNEKHVAEQLKSKYCASVQHYSAVIEITCACSLRGTPRGQKRDIHLALDVGLRM